MQLFKDDKTHINILKLDRYKTSLSKKKATVGSGFL